MENLEKVDIIRERTGVSYKEAKEMLEISNGDLVDALIGIEEKQDKTWVNSMTLAGNEIMEKLRAMIKKGNVSRIILKKEGETLLNLPVTAGALGAIGVMSNPLISLIGLSAAVVTRPTIEIVKEDGEIVDISEVAADTVSEIKSMVKGKKGIDIRKKEVIDDLMANGQEEIIDQLGGED